MQVFRHLNGSHPSSILTIGNYDGIHLGHQAILNKLIVSAKKNNLLSSVMTFEPHPKEFFYPNDAPARIISLREKLEYFDEKKKLTKSLSLSLTMNFPTLLALNLSIY